MENPPKNTKCIRRKTNLALIAKQCVRNLTAQAQLILEPEALLQVMEVVMRIRGSLRCFLKKQNATVEIYLWKYFSQMIFQPTVQELVIVTFALNTVPPTTRTRKVGWQF